MYDLDLIREMVPMEAMADFLGIPTRRKGKYLQALCPFHGDEHFGSAEIRDKSLICYVCAQHYSIFDVYGFIKGLRFKDSVAGIIRDFSLPMDIVSDDVKTVEGSRRKIPPLSREELKTIGLIPERRRLERYPYAAADSPQWEKGCTCAKDTDGQYVLSRKGKTAYQHLMALYNDEPETFFWLVENKCREKVDDYSRIADLHLAVCGELEEHRVPSTDIKVFQNLLSASLQQAEAVCEAFEKARESA